MERSLQPAMGVWNWIHDGLVEEIRKKEGNEASLPGSQCAKTTEIRGLAAAGTPTRR